MSARFRLCETPIPGLIVVERARLGDARGHLERIFCAEELAAAGWSGPVAQVNRTWTAARGTVRGMHFQRPPYAEIKLVQCLRGVVYDVAIDLRPDSPTRLRWHAVELSPDNRRALLVPRGFAHGFQALTSDVEMLYFHSAPYLAAAEGGIHPNDPAVGIEWPLEVVALSDRDATHPPLTAEFQGVRA